MHYLRYLSKLGRVADFLSRRIGGVSACILVAMSCLIATNVFLRYILNRPFIHTDEIVRDMVSWIAFLGLTYALLWNSHLRADFLISLVKGKVRRTIEIICISLMMVWVGTLLYGGWLFWLRLVKTGAESYGMLRIALWIPAICVILGLTVFAFQLVVEVVRIVKYYGKAGTKYAERRPSGEAEL